MVLARVFVAQNMLLAGLRRAQGFSAGIIP